MAICRVRRPMVFVSLALGIFAAAAPVAAADGATQAPGTSLAATDPFEPPRLAWFPWQTRKDNQPGGDEIGLEYRTLLSDVTFDLPGSSPDVSQGESDVRVTGARRHNRRAVIEGATLLSLWAIRYWTKYASYVEDWQFKLNWSDQKRKFFSSEGFRLDSNNMKLNWSHAAAGAFYYSVARSNGFGTRLSFAYATAESLLWEYFVEYRELSSINDHVFTAVGGVGIAEPLFQISSYFRYRAGLFNRIATALTNPLVAFNDLIDGKKRQPRVPDNQWHDFRLSTGGLTGAALPGNRSATQTVLNLDLRLITLPDYGKSGTAGGRFRNTIDNGLHFQMSVLDGRVEELNVATRAMLFGQRWKDVSQDEQGRRRGYDIWFGTPIAWDLYQRRPVAPYDGANVGMADIWFERERPTRYSDKLSSVHFPGLGTSLTAYAGRLRTRLELGAALNFSLVNSLPFNQYSATHAIWGVKTTLHNWGYYYGIGPTLTGRVEAEYGQWRLAAGVDYRRFASIQGLDRYQGDITDDGRLTDSRLVSSVSLSAALPRSPLFATVKLEGIDRRGQFHETSVRLRETRVSYELGISF